MGLENELPEKLSLALLPSLPSLNGVSPTLTPLKFPESSIPTSSKAPVTTNPILSTTTFLNDQTYLSNKDGSTEYPDYLQLILNARVYDVAIESPLTLATKLSSRLGSKIYLKREDLQPIFSFKCRGAYNRMYRLTAEEKKRGVIAVSAGKLGFVKEGKD